MAHCALAGVRILVAEAMIRRKIIMIRFILQI
jgi:hypothetical protein